MIDMEEKKKTHRFDVFDTCERCGVERKKVPNVGSGYNAMLSNRFTNHYSNDGGKTFSHDYINCKTNKK